MTLPLSSSVQSSSVAQASRRPELVAAREAARKQLVTFDKEAKAARAELGKALKSLGTEFRSIGSTLDAGRRTAEGKYPRLMLARDLKMIQNLRSAGRIGDDTALRLKDNRIKRLSSSSLWKPLFGYGKAERNDQATALANRHQLSDAAIAGGITEKVLKQHESRAVEQDRATASDVLKASTPALRKAIQAVASVASRGADVTPEWLDARVQQDVDWLCSGVQQQVEDSKRAVDLETVLKHFTSEVSNDVRKGMDETRADLLSSLMTCKEDLQSFDRQERIETRMPSLAGLVSPDPAARRQLMRSTEKSLVELGGDGRFDSVYGTNEGCQAVQKMLRGSSEPLKGKTIADELEARHGPKYFHVYNRRSALKAYASGLTRGVLDKIAHAQRTLGLLRHAAGDEETTTWRRSTHSAAMLNTLVETAGSTSLLRPQQFLSTAYTQEETEKYPVAGSSGGHAVKFAITGFSSMPVAAVFVGERDERVYTHLSAFTVSQVSRDAKDGAYIVRLQEVPASIEELNQATLLKF